MPTPAPAVNNTAVAIAARNYAAAAVKSAARAAKALAKEGGHIQSDADAFTTAVIQPALRMPGIVFAPQHVTNTKVASYSKHAIRSYTPQVHDHQASDAGMDVVNGLPTPKKDSARLFRNVLALMDVHSVAAFIRYTFPQSDLISYVGQQDGPFNSLAQYHLHVSAAELSTGMTNVLAAHLKYNNLAYIVASVFKTAICG